MAFVIPPMTQIVNFFAAARKGSLIAFGFCSPNDNLPNAIYSVNSGVSLTITGTIDGTNATFTLSATPANLQLMRNGVEQLQGTMFTIAGNVVTFLAPYIPQVGDYLIARSF